MTMRLILITISLFLLAGCQSLWTRIDAKTATYSDKNYSVNLPIDWVRAKSDETIYITKDGISVQQLTITFSEHADAFSETKQKSEADMFPSELADRYVAELRATDENGLPSLEIINNQPTKIDGRAGFELHLKFLSEGGLRYERLVAGFANEDGFFVVSYQAPTLHFFNRDREAFDTLVGSFKSI